MTKVADVFLSLSFYFAFSFSLLSVLGCAGPSLLHGLPVSVASLAAEHGFRGARASLVAAPGLEHRAW